ncbi:hypothetical protein CLU79DRAFT_887844 [Phycomyces nitens]|nr:hypothetical protein CLU79DRAFT_887844 [Phycomyces nitens]
MIVDSSMPTTQWPIENGSQPSILNNESLHCLGLLGYSIEVNIFQWPALKRQEFLRSHSRWSRLVMMRSVEHGCDSVVLVSVASGIGWVTGRFSAGESLYGLLGCSIEVTLFRWPALKHQEFLSSHSRRSRLVMMRSVKHGCDSVVLVSVASGIGWATGRFSAGESLHEFLSSHSRWSRLVMMRSVGPDIRLSLSYQLSGIPGGRPVSFLAGESLHGLLGYSVEVNIFRWPALKRQEFLSSHSRWSRLVMMRSVEHGCDSVVLVSVASGIGWVTGRFSAGESLYVPISASLYHTNCLEFRWTQEHGCDSVVLVSVASGIGWAIGRFSAGESLHEFLSSHSRRSRLVMMRSVGPDIRLSLSYQLSGIPGGRPVSFLAGESLHGLLGYSVEVNIFRWPALKHQEFLSSHSRRSRLVMMRSVGPDIRLSLSYQLSGIPGGRPVSFLAGESLHGLLGYSVEVNIFRWPALKRQEFLSSHSRWSRLVMMRSVGPDIRLSLSYQLSGIPGGRPVSFLAGESLHGLLGYSVEVNIFRWPALKRQEFLSSHSRWSRLVMMRSVGPDIRLSLSHQLSGIPGGRPVSFLAGESLHGLLGYSVEVNIFRWPALKHQEFLSSHSRRSRLVMMRSVGPISASLYHTNCLEFRWTQEHGCDSVVLVSVASGIGWAIGRFSAGESLHEFLSSHSRRSRLVMMRSVGPDIRLSLSYQLSGIPGGRPVSFLAGESLHGLLGYSVEVNIFRWPALKHQEFLSSHSRRSRLVMMRSVGPDIRLSLSYQLSGIPGGRPVSFLAGESLHGLLGYSVEVNIFRWPALKRQEFLSSHSRWSRLVMMRSVGPDIRLSLSYQLSGIPGGRPVSFLAGESLHGLLGYSVEVNIFRWPALKRQEFLSSHSRWSRLVMMRSVGPDIRLSLSHQLSGIPVDSRTWM